MKKVLIALLLVSTVIGMTMPAMANPTISKIVNNKIQGTNWASSSVDQSQVNTGDLVNKNTQVAVGGTATADSKAKGNANAQDQSSHDADAQGEDSTAGGDTSGAANVLSGNAISGADATGGDATNGNNIQVNAVVQFATADITTTQDLIQTIDETETQDLTIDDSAFVEGNHIDDSNLAASGDDEATVDN